MELQLSQLLLQRLNLTLAGPLLHLAIAAELLAYVVDHLRDIPADQAHALAQARVPPIQQRRLAPGLVELPGQVVDRAFDPADLGFDAFLLVAATPHLGAYFLAELLRTSQRLDRLLGPVRQLPQDLQPFVDDLQGALLQRLGGGQHPRLHLFAHLREPLQPQVELLCLLPHLLLPVRQHAERLPQLLQLRLACRRLRGQQLEPVLHALHPAQGFPKLPAGGERFRVAGALVRLHRRPRLREGRADLLGVL